MEILKDVWDYLKIRKKWWLLPMLLVLALFGILIALSANPATVPFVYTLF